MKYVYEDIQLRAIEESDLDMLREMINDPEIESMTGGFSFPVSEYQQKKWFESLSANEKEFRAVIDTQEHGSIGVVMLTDISWINRTAQLHIKIATSKQIRGRGYGTKAIKALVKYAFAQMNLNIVYSHILENNVASRKAHQKSGFKEEAILRDRVFKNESYHNLIVCSIRKDEIVE